MRARITIILFACGVILPGVVFLLLHIAGPSDGAYLAPGQAVWRSDGIVVTPLRPDGLRPGDVVVAIDGKSTESWAQELFQFDRARPQWHIGQTIPYTVVRNGRTLNVAVKLGTYPLDAILIQQWSTILYALVFLLVAVFVFMLRSGEHAARVQLLLAASMVGATTWSFGLQVSDLVNAAGFWLFVATTLVVYLLFWISILHFALIFPRPHPIIIKWRFLIPLIYSAPYITTLMVVFGARLFVVSTLSWIKQWSLTTGIFPSIFSVLALILVLWSYRTTQGNADRQKIRWIVYAGLLSGSGGLFLWQIPNVLGHPLISSNALGLLVLPYPFALAIAILRYRLFDIDIIINRTLVYGSLTVSIVGLYVLLVSLVSLLLHPTSTFLPSLVVVGLVAVLFQPLRARLQRIVNRLMYGERDDPYAVLARLGTRLETTLTPEAVLPTVVQTIAQALKLPYAAISLKQGEAFIISATYGSVQQQLFTLPLVYQGELVGQLQLALRGLNEDFTAADQRLLAAIAAQVGVATHAVRLTADLQRSREHLVTTREEERRRLRRDLHDGLGPTLASMTLKLDAARNLLRQNSSALDPLLCELKAQTQATIMDIRRLVYDLRPPALDELGLVSALREQITRYSQESEVHMVIEAPVSLPALPAAVEVAAYRIVLEAVTNVMRHAHARTCTVRFQVSDVLTVEVSDDGMGIARGYTVGVGITSMRERTAELGGTCRIEKIDQGTHIFVQFPLRANG